METPSVLLICILVTCSVWAVQGRSVEVSIDDEKQLEISVEAHADLPLGIKLPGMCWGCKWALNKVKKIIGRNATAEKLKSKLNDVCNNIGLLKNACRKFVKTHLGVLIEELTTTDDVRTICVNTGACKPKELMELLFYPVEEDEETGLMTSPDENISLHFN